MQEDEKLVDIVGQLQDEADRIQSQLDAMGPVSCPHTLCESCMKLSSDQDALKASLTVQLEEKRNIMSKLS